MAMRHDLQYCIGAYEESDSACKGCYWCNTCAAFKQYLLDESLQADDVLEIVSIENGHIAVPKIGRNEFDQLVAGMVKKYGFVGGISTKEPSLPTKRKNKNRKHIKRNVPKVVQRKAVKAIQSLAQEKRVVLKKLFEWFKMNLVESLNGYVFSLPNHAVLPGRLFVVDRLKKSGYISIYCKSPSGCDVPLALAAFKTRRMVLDIEVPVEYTGYKVGKAALKLLRPQPCSDGKFLSVMKSLDKERVALAAKVVASLVNDGLIKLPVAR
jgi:hypothetical protein